MTTAKVLCVIFVFLHTCDIGFAQQTCPGKAENCIQKDKFNQLSQQDANYCIQGPILVAEAQNCLRACEASESDPTLNDIKNQINTFCKQKDDKCDLVTDVYVAQTRCFDQYFGLENVTNRILHQFITNDDLDCQQFYWGRYCQKTQRCSFNAQLDLTIVKDNPVIALALSICGSETLKTVLPALDRTDGCKPDSEKTIKEKCDISCAAANAPDTGTLCRLLEKQAACLEEQTVGCSALEKRLVLPRLNTYAVANKHLSCNIMYKKVPVKTTGRDCHYSGLINSCLLTGIIENALSFYQFQPLTNRDTVVLQLCSTKAKQNDMLVACKNAFIPCLSVQAKLFVVNDTEVLSFLPEIGSFSVDQHGMKYLYDSLPATCPKGLMWSDRICVPDDNKRGVDENLVTKGSDDKVLESRSTANKYTPTRQARGDTPTRDAGDFHKSMASAVTKMIKHRNTPPRKTTEPRTERPTPTLRPTPSLKPNNS